MLEPRLRRSGPMYDTAAVASALTSCPELAVPLDRLARRMREMTGETPTVARLAGRLRAMPGVVLLEPRPPWMSPRTWSYRDLDAYRPALRDLGLDHGPLAVRRPGTAGHVSVDPPRVIEDSLRRTIVAVSSAPSADPHQTLTMIRAAEATRRAISQIPWRSTRTTSPLPDPPPSGEDRSRSRPGPAPAPPAPGSPRGPARPRAPWPRRAGAGAVR